jgi:hypothetical protein
MSQENVELVRKGVQAFLETDFEAWFALASPDYKLYGKAVEWRMFGPVEEAFEALGLPQMGRDGFEPSTDGL